MVLDSNIIVYSIRPEYSYVLPSFNAGCIQASIVTRIEVLGFHGLIPDERDLLLSLFSAIEILPLTDEVATRAIELRQRVRLKLPDAVIAATALVHHVPLMTRNVADFSQVPGLHLMNPIR